MSEIMDPAYQRFDRQLQKLLISQGWHKATMLAEGFADAQDAFDMLHSMAMGQETDATLNRWSAALVRWKDEMGPSLSLARRRIAQSTGEERSMALRARISPPEVKMDAKHPLLLKVLFVKAHWKTRRSARLGRAKDPNSRKEIEVLERERWGYKIADILILAETPVCSQASLSGNPRAAILGMLVLKRSRTLRGRYRVWVKIRLWLNCNFDVEWPRHIGHMLDYLRDLESSGCPKTLPMTISGSLSYMERVGGYTAAESISGTVLWRDNVNGLKLRLQEEAGGTVVCKAPQYFVSMILSMELYVVSGRSLFKRAFCWIKLIKTWATLRWDDLQGLAPSRMTYNPKTVWRGVLTRTKTTGPGKKVGELPVYIHSGCGFSGKPWMETGFKIWTSKAFSFPRDFMVMNPASNYEGPGVKMMDYNQASSLSRLILRELHRPVWAGEDLGWREAESFLIIPGGQLFFTEHSERHFAPCVAAAIGIPPEPRDNLGRWGVNQKNSNNYVLTARQVITNIQVKICEAISKGPNQYDEEELQDEYARYLEERAGYDKAEALEAALKMKDCYPDSGNTLAQEWPLTEQEFLDEAAIQASSDHPEHLLKKMQSEEDGGLEQPFWVSIGRTGFRRLHRLGGCHIRKEDCNHWQSLDWEAAERNKSDEACKLCWPDLQKDASEEESSGEESSGSSSSEPISDEEGQAV